MTSKGESRNENNNLKVKSPSKVKRIDEANRVTPNLTNSTGPKVEVKVSEEGVVTVGNYKLGKFQPHVNLTYRSRSRQGDFWKG